MIMDFILMLVCIIFCTIILFMITISNISMGKLLNEHEMGGKTKNVWSSPGNTMKWVTVVTWILLIFGVGLTFVDSTMALVFGTIIVGCSLMFAFTAFAFAMCVLKAFNEKLKEKKFVDSMLGEVTPTM